MMGSPFYYDVLFDDGPGDVVFHDCMWSGICTCCIQLLHQDSLFYANESPDLKVDLSYQQLTSSANNNINNNLNSSSYLTTKDAHHRNNYSYIQHQQDLKVAGHLNLNQSQNHHPNSGDHHNHQHHFDSALTLSSSSNSPVTANSLSSSASSSSSSSSSSSIGANNNINNNKPNTNNRNTSQDKLHSSSSTSISPDHTASSSNSTSPDTASSLSNSISPKPVRRREHNDSERKRRDHLRNAFNFLRDQVPRFKAINKKPPRIQILHEATLYVKNIMKESQDLERRLQEERAKHERLQNL